MKIDEICTYAPKSSIKAGEAVEDGKYMFFTSSTDESKRYSEFQYDGDGIIMGTGGNATLHYYSGKFSTSTDCIVLFPNNNIICKYLYYFFCANIHILENGFKGAGLKHTNKKYIGSIDIPIIPPIHKQNEIIKKLDTLQSIITHRKQQLEKLDELVKARFVEMFGDCENEVPIGDVISISRGASPRPISAFITNSEDGVNWIKIGDVSENSLYITRTEERITPKGAQKSRMVHKGDFILSNSMSFGRPYILGIDGCVHDGWLIMSNFNGTFNELYLYHAIRDNDVQSQFNGKVNGATVKNLNSDLVKSTTIKVPTMEMQEQFATFVKQTDKSKATVQKSLDEAQLLFDSLMQEYFG